MTETEFHEFLLDQLSLSTQIQMEVKNELAKQDNFTHEQERYVHCIRFKVMELQGILKDAINTCTKAKG